MERGGDNNDVFISSIGKVANVVSNDGHVAPIDTLEPVPLTCYNQVKKTTTKMFIEFREKAREEFGLVDISVLTYDGVAPSSDGHGESRWWVEFGKRRKNG